MPAAAASATTCAHENSAPIMKIAPAQAIAISDAIRASRLPRACGVKASHAIEGIIAADAIRVGRKSRLDPDAVETTVRMVRMTGTKRYRPIRALWRRKACQMSHPADEAAASVARVMSAPPNPAAYTTTEPTILALKDRSAQSVRSAILAIRQALYLSPNLTLWVAGLQDFLP